MLSILLIKCLLASYIVIMVVCLVEKNYLLALYWLGASILQTSVILMATSGGR